MDAIHFDEKGIQKIFVFASQTVVSRLQQKMIPVIFNCQFVFIIKYN